MHKKNVVTRENLLAMRIIDFGDYCKAFSSRVMFDMRCRLQYT
jgi:Ser/Thr protein kinase RdoA (MazF antagonist)